VGDIQKECLPHPLAPLLKPLRMARGKEAAGAAGENQQSFFPARRTSKLYSKQPVFSYNTNMEEILKAILDALDIEIVFVDTTHTIRFMNEYAVNNYKDRFGTDLIGKSIFNCHTHNSKRLILQGFLELSQGKDKVLVFENEKVKEYMVGVRNEKGTLLGYFEITERV